MTFSLLKQGKFEYYRVKFVRSIYGYRDCDSTFLKISLTDPADVTNLGDLLLSGAVFGYPVQPYEVHIPYLLQVCLIY